MFSKSLFNIIDEADNLENTLIEFTALSFTSYALGRLGLKDEIDNLQKTSRDHDKLLDTWKQFADVARTRCSSILGKLTRTIKSYGEHPSSPPIREIRESVRVGRLLSKIDLFTDNVDPTWMIDASEDKFTFRPLWLTENLADKFLWSHAQKWVLMSASFLPIKLEAKRLGIPLEDIDYKLVPSTFPVHSRLIHLESAANLTAKTMDIETPKLVNRIREIVCSHPDEKGLIHAVSYKLANLITDSLSMPRVITHNSRDRQEVLDRFRQSDLPLVLVSPSCERGVSLEDDLCRFVIVAKAPWLYLGDKIVAARVYSSRLGQEWFAATMLLTVLQMTGRAMRSEWDYCESFILDAQFRQTYLLRMSWLPAWWREAVRDKDSW
jgi:Rad3-related DNA helicase